MENGIKAPAFPLSNLKNPDLYQFLFTVMFVSGFFLAIIGLLGFVGPLPMIAGLILGLVSRFIIYLVSHS